MKPSILFLLIWGLINQINASNEQFIKANITSVKVFLRGAEITHSAKVKLEKGKSELIFTDVAQNIDPNSINISAKGELVILSVNQKVDYLKTPEKSKQIKMLEDSLEILNKILSSKQNEIDVLKAEIDLLYANKEIGSKEKGVTVNELQKFGEYFRKRLTEIKNKTTEISLDIKNIQKNIERITKQLNELNNNINKPVNELVVSVSVKSKCDAEFVISYLVNDASWQPVYDIRVNKIDSPAILNYKASIKQNSGLDWENVDIVLSTRNTIQNNNKPELYPWFVDFEKPMLRKEVGLSQKVFSPMSNVVESSAESETLADYFEVAQSQLSAEFIPSIKYSIPSDNKNHIIELQNFTIPAKYEYYAVPKLDNNAFLIAYLSSWNEFNLLPGEVNIYFENSFVGKTYINPFTSKDTLTISLGRDQNISCSKQTIKDFTESKFLSSDVERIFAYEIKIKNNKTIPIKLIVEDQIPISKNDQIKIKLIDSDKGLFFENEGRIRWTIDLNGSESATKKLIYSVRYPKDKIIPNL
ncbi:MAG: mucoidy inhibitor MuiA family protein [Melioribacteraceae bacterium]